MHGSAKVKIFFVLYNVSRPGSSAGIATELRAGRSGDRVPVEARFSAIVRPARPRTQHGYHHDTKVKPEAATAVIGLLMKGRNTPETC
jgi:hypothetical protein